MTDTTLDEARRCPKCNELGKDESRRRGPHGSYIHTIRCLNSRCRWFNTTYIIQVQSDGTVNPPILERDRSFPKIPDRTDQVQAQLDRLYQSQIKPGSETR